MRVYASSVAKLLRKARSFRLPFPTRARPLIFHHVSLNLPANRHSGGRAARFAGPGAAHYVIGMHVLTLEPYHLFDTAIGACGIAWSERGLTRLQLPEADRARTERRLRARSHDGAPADPPERMRQAVSDLQSYFTGQRVDFSSVPLDLEGVSPFDRKVYDAARQIPWGETKSYGELAQRAGCPGEAREVGQSLSRNPIAVIVPCHRILAKGGKLGGFSAYGGTFTKEQLLALEGVDLDGDAPMLPGLLPERARRGRA